jgi:hypothetical protein
MLFTCLPSHSRSAYHLITLSTAFLTLSATYWTIHLSDITDRLVGLWLLA